jgi:hypothetical protein
MMSRLQSGFRSQPQPSKKITNGLLSASEEKLISILVLLDFLKAFDSVNHQLLCSKLSCQYKFSTMVLSLRPNAIGLGKKSEILLVASGVVQSSLLFSLFINDYSIWSISPVCRRDGHVYISCHPLDYVDFFSRFKPDLGHILQYSLRNGL